MPLDLLSTPLHERQFSDLVDRAFGLKDGAHFVSDFPIWDAALSPRGTTKLGVWENNELVACAGVRIAQLKTDTRKLCPVALIGAVATAESHRGKGYASQIVTLAGEWATAKGAALSILWGSEHALYERIGYELCGKQVRAPIPKSDANPASNFTFHSGWSDRIFDQMKKRRLGLLLDESDRRWMAAHQGTHWYWVEREGSLVAYAALGRGIDLPNLVHEWWGIDQAERQALFYGIHKVHPHAELLGQPELLSIEGIPFFPDAVEFLGLMKVLDPGKVIETFAYPGYRPTGEGARGFFGPGEGALKIWLWGLDAV